MQPDPQSISHFLNRDGMLTVIHDDDSIRIVNNNISVRIHKNMFASLYIDKNQTAIILGKICIHHPVSIYHRGVVAAGRLLTKTAIKINKGIAELLLAIDTHKSMANDLAIIDHIKGLGAENVAIHHTRHMVVLNRPGNNFSAINRRSNGGRLQCENGTSQRQQREHPSCFAHTITLPQSNVLCNSTINGLTRNLLSNISRGDAPSTEDVI